MNEFLAIVADTWRQSRAQVVYLIMVIILALIAVCAAILPKTVKDKNGEDQFALLWMSEPAGGFDDMWINSYAQTLAINAGERVVDFDQDKSQQREIQKRYLAEATERAKAIPKLNRSVEMYAYGVSYIVFMVAMMFFIGACAGYFPDMLAAGAIDVVISKPISRLKILFGKYIGGLILFTILMLGVYFILYVGIGLRTGIWNWRVIMPGPITLLSAAVLYAIIAVYGIVWRSTSLCIVIGYVFYVVVDTLIGIVLDLYTAGVFSSNPTIERICSVTRTVMPNFGLLKQLATASVLNMPAFDWGPIGTAAAWLVGSLGLAYFFLRRKDF